MTPLLLAVILAEAIIVVSRQKIFLIKMEEMNQGAAEVVAEETTATEVAAETSATENVEQPATVEETPSEEASTPDETEAAA